MACFNLTLMTTSPPAKRLALIDSTLLSPPTELGSAVFSAILLCAFTLIANTANMAAANRTRHRAGLMN